MEGSEGREGWGSGLRWMWEAIYYGNTVLPGELD